jgi:hypothetical protein
LHSFATVDAACWLEAAFNKWQQARVFQGRDAMTHTRHVFLVGCECHKGGSARLPYQHCRIPSFFSRTDQKLVTLPEE